MSRRNSPIATLALLAVISSVATARGVKKAALVDTTSNYTKKAEPQPMVPIPGVDPFQSPLPGSPAPAVQIPGASPSLPGSPAPPVQIPGASPSLLGSPAPPVQIPGASPGWLPGNFTKAQLPYTNSTKLPVPASPCPAGDTACFCRWKGALGMFADPASGCQNYYWCVGTAESQQYYKQCSPGLRFNEDIHNCDWPQNVPCAGAGAPPPAPSPPTPAQGGSGCTCTCPSQSPAPSAPPSNPAPPSPTSPSPSPPSGSGTFLGTARATYHYYGPTGGLSYGVDGLYCTDAFAGKSREWLMQYPWTAYCMNASPLGGMKASLCGQCLGVTNKRTGARQVARIVDMCGNGALDMDFDSTFKMLDTDGQGYNDGHMMVDVELVPC